YLLPSNFFETDVESVPGNSINLYADVAEKFSSVDTALQIIITDSCRTPVPTNLNRTSGPSARATPGAKEPSKKMPAPVQTTFGKGRVVYLYSTLDGQASFGATDTGGRFTRALKAASAKALA